MEKIFYTENRRKLYDMLEPQSLLVLFAGLPIRKSADACYPFYADRNFVYFTGIEQSQSVLLTQEDGCENLSAGIPRTVEEIEAVMRK